MIPDSFLDTWRLSDLDDALKTEALENGIKGDCMYRGSVEYAIELTKCPYCGEYLLDENTPPCEHCVLIFSWEHFLEYIDLWLEPLIGMTLEHVSDLDEVNLESLQVVLTEEDAPDNDYMTAGWVKTRRRD